MRVIQGSLMPHSPDCSPTLPAGCPPFSHGPRLEPAVSTASPGTPEMVRRVCGRGLGRRPRDSPVRVRWLFRDLNRR